MLNVEMLNYDKAVDMTNIAIIILFSLNSGKANNRIQLLMLKSNMLGMSTCTDFIGQCSALSGDVELHQKLGHVQLFFLCQKPFESGTPLCQHVWRLQCYCWTEHFRHWSNQLCFHFHQELGLLKQWFLADNCLQYLSF